MFAIADDGPVRTVTIDNPGRRNAIPHEGWRRLTEIAEDFATSESRTLVLTGAGGDFCSGADLGADITAVDGTAATRYEWMLDVGAAARAMPAVPRGAPAKRLRRPSKRAACLQQCIASCGGDANCERSCAVQECVR